MIPVNTAKRGYLPNRVISLWDYSDICDSRFRMSNSMVRIRQDSFIRKAFKAGFNLEDGFAVYAVKEQIFAKCIPEYKDVCYPDFPATLRFTPTIFSLNVSFWAKSGNLQAARKLCFVKSGVFLTTVIMLSRPI